MATATSIPSAEDFAKETLMEVIFADERVNDYLDKASLRMLNEHFQFEYDMTWLNENDHTVQYFLFWELRNGLTHRLLAEVQTHMRFYIYQNQM